MFGKPASNLFGSTANTSFGGNAFGTPNNTGFGAGTTFGSSPFGATNQQQQQQPQGTGMFGASTSNPLGGGSLFGNTSMSFGTSTSNTGFSFGGNAGMQSTPQNTSLFGPTSGPTAGSLFGTPAQQTAGFGQPATGGAMNLFGGVGGTTATNTAGFLGGLGAGQSGTTIKFVPLPGTDVMVKGGNSVTISTKMQCITGMKEYENKSLEELRFEDYQANRKAGSTLASGLGSSFLSTSQQQAQSTGFGMFGAQNKTAFSGFGTSAASTGSSLFGASSLPQAKPLFGATSSTTTTTASSGFGSMSTGSLFGNKSTNSLFGSTATTTQSSGFFGNTQPQASMGFGGLGTQNTNTGGLFGAKPLGFSQTATTTASSFGFGAPQASQSGLGGAFGGGSLFNKPAASATPAFGLGTQNTSIGFGGFGQQTSLGSASGFGSFGATNTGSLFSNQQKPAGSLFGNTATPGFGLGTGLGGTSLTGGLGTTGTTGGLGLGFGANTSLLGGQQTLQLQPQQQQQQLQNNELMAILEQQKQLQQQISALNSSPYGDNPLFKNLVGSSDASRQSDLLKPTNPVAQQALLSSQLRYRHGHEKATLRTTPLPMKSEKSLLFDCLDEDNLNGVWGGAHHSGGPHDSEETFTPRRNFKHLNVSSILAQQQSFNSARGEGRPKGPGEGALPPSAVGAANGSAAKSPALNSEFGRSTLGGLKMKSRVDFEDSKLDGNPFDNTMNELLPRPSSGANQRITPTTNKENNSANNNPDEIDAEESAVGATPKAPHPAGVVLTRPDYFTLPSLEEMAATTDEKGVCVVRDLVVGREGYGNVFFPGETNVTNLNLDELVHFRRKEIEIYPDSTVKHSQGQGLNKKAQVTLDMVYPVDKTTKEPITDYNRLMGMGFVETLEKRCIKMNAKFVEYRPETGSYVFIVDHFSKYGLLDESDEEEPNPNAAKMAGDVKKQPLPSTKPPVAGKDKQLFTPVKTKKVTTFDVSGDDEKMYEDSALDQFKMGIRTTPYPRAGPKGDDSSYAMDEDEFGDDLKKFKERFATESTTAMMSMDRDVESEIDFAAATVESPTSPCGGLGDVSVHRVQLQKASFFGSMDIAGDDDDEDDKDAVMVEVTRRKGVKVGREESMKIEDMSFSNQMKMTGSLSIFGNSSLAMMTDDVIIKQLPPPPPAASAPFSGRRPQDESKLHLPTTPFKSDHPVVASCMTEEDLRELQESRPTTEKKRSVVAFESSLMNGRQGLHQDLGLHHGISTRAGWGSSGLDDRRPGWVVAHVGAPMNPDDEETEKSGKIGGFMSKFVSKMASNADDSLCVKVERIFPPGLKANDSIKDMLCACLQAELDHVQVECQWMEVGATGAPAPDILSVECPLFSFSLEPQSLLSAVDRELEKFGNQSEWSKNMSSLWRLCISLWGDMGGKGCYYYDDDDYYNQSLRKAGLTKWLTREAESSIEQEVKVLDNDNMEGHVTFVHLTGFRVREAVEAAVKGGDLHLALLLSQAAGPEESRIVLRKQLELWSDSKSDSFMSESRLATYALLAGILVLRTSRGTINCCRSLDWKRCFGLHLWYACPATCSISEALAEYERGFRGGTAHGRYCAAPNPAYMEKWGMDEDAGVSDVAYRLLKLFCNKNYPLHSILDPTAFGENVLDYSCSWHLMKLLGSLGYKQISNFHASSVCHNYASQLEALGMWHWAAFALMHIPHPLSRTDAVKKLISRNVVLIPQEVAKPGKEKKKKRKTMDDLADDSRSKAGKAEEEEEMMVSIERTQNDDDDDDDDGSRDLDGNEDERLLDEKERFLVEKLSIPVEWIHEAKATRANSEGLVELRAVHLLRARRFALYHDLVVQEIAPTAVANGDLDSLRRWFQRMDRAAGWKGYEGAGRFDRGGGAYLEYVRLVEVVERIDALEESKDEECCLEDRQDLIRELEPLVRLLGKKIKSLPDDKPIDRYAQQVMAQALLKGSLKLLSVDRGSHEENREYAIRLLDSLESLPIPEEFLEEAHVRISHEFLKNLILRCIEQL